MRLVFDLAGVVNAGAIVLGLLWKRRRRQRRLSNLEHVRQLERENAEIDSINARMGAGTSAPIGYDRSDERRRGGLDRE